MNFDESLSRAQAIAKFCDKDKELVFVGASVEAMLIVNTNHANSHLMYFKDDRVLENIHANSFNYISPYLCFVGIRSAKFSALEQVIIDVDQWAANRTSINAIMLDSLINKLMLNQLTASPLIAYGDELRLNLFLDTYPTLVKKRVFGTATDKDINVYCGIKI